MSDIVPRRTSSALTRRAARTIEGIDVRTSVDAAQADSIVRRAEARSAAITDITGSACSDALRLSKLRSQLELMNPAASSALAALEEINTIALMGVVENAARQLRRL